MKQTEVGCPNYGDCEYREQVMCRRCQVDVSEPFGSRNVRDAFWEIRGRPAPQDAAQAGR